MKSVIETFKDIPGCDGLYQVSDYGAVRNIHGRKVRYLKPAKSRGYDTVCLYLDGVRKWHLVHRLVYETFYGPIPDGMQIDHINGVRGDNRLSNLRVVTPKENSNNPITRERHLEAMKKIAKDPEWQKKHRKAMKKVHADPEWLRGVREGSKKRSENEEYRRNQKEGVMKKLNKPILQLDKSTGEVIRQWNSATEAGEELGIGRGNISSCCNGALKSAYGFKWKFAE